MSDTKLRPEDLTSEERAFNKLTPTQTELLALLSEECGEVVQVIGKILRHGLESFHPNGGPTNRELLAEEIGDCLCASRLLASAGMLNMASVEDRSAEKMEKVFRYLHHARRALFAPAPEKVAKVECPNCGEMTERSHSRYEGPGPDKWACQPAPPEPAAREMPEAVKNAWKALRKENYETFALALESWWRTHAQPVAVKVYHYPSNEMPGWAECGEQIERGDSMPEWNHVTCERCQGYYRARREYEQKLAAQGRKVELGKARKMLEYMRRCAWHEETYQQIEEALAELDAAEKGEGRG